MIREGEREKEGDKECQGAAVIDRILEKIKLFEDLMKLVRVLNEVRLLEVGLGCLP